MAKNPAFQFYPRDWLSDTELQQASAVTRGIWINLLSHMWFATDRGVVSGTLDEMRRLSGCSEPEWLVFYEQNCRLKFADVTFSDGIVTVKNRRMVREERARNLATCRKSRQRSRACHAEVTPPSPSPSTPSPSAKKEKHLSNPDGFDAFWIVYPRKEGKEDAKKAWKKLAPENGLVERIIASIEEHKPKWTDPQYIPLPASYLRGKRWEDVLNTPTSSQIRRDPKSMWKSQEEYLSHKKRAGIDPRYRVPEWETPSDAASVTGTLPLPGTATTAKRGPST